MKLLLGTILARWVRMLGGGGECMFWGNCDCIGTDIIMNASTKVCMYWGGGGGKYVCDGMQLLGQECSYWGKNACSFIISEALRSR